MNTKLSNTKFKQTVSMKPCYENLINNVNIVPNGSKYDQKVVGNTKHVIPNNKEWSNSIYSFNKNYITDISVKNKLINRLVSNYMHMDIYQKTKNISGLREQRMIRKQIRINRKSLKGITITRPEIKYTNDKVIITFYVSDKEKESVLRKAFFFSRSFRFNKILKLYLTKLTGKKEKTQKMQLFNRSDHKIKTKNNKFIMQQISKSKINSLSLYSYLDSTNDYKLFKKKFIISLIKKKDFVKNVFFFTFLKWTLLSLMIKVYIINSNNNKYILFVDPKNNSKSILRIRNNLFLDKLKKVNNLLLTLVFRAISNHKSVSKEKILPLLFEYYKNKYLTKFIVRYMRKQSLFLHYMFKLSLNNFKYNKFIPGIKIITDKVFNKKVELNFVNLKYLHLDTSIFVKSIATRLKRKTTQLLLVLKRSLKLIKLPFKLNLLASKSMINNSNDYSKLNSLNNYKNRNLNLIGHSNIKYNKSYFNHEDKDLLTNSLENIFSFLNNFQKNLSNKVNAGTIDQQNILNSIKYKWVKGARIEAKGRLTKRYTASRSVFKYKYKGNLKDLSYYGNLSSSMSRGNIKSNVIYTFVKSKRRIGAFGIKGWISTY